MNKPSAVNETSKAAGSETTQSDGAVGEVKAIAAYAAGVNVKYAIAVESMIVKYFFIIEYPFKK
jgi:hypothetical protein